MEGIIQLDIDWWDVQVKSRTLVTYLWFLWLVWCAPLLSGRPAHGALYACTFGFWNWLDARLLFAYDIILQVPTKAYLLESASKFSASNAFFFLALSILLLGAHMHFSAWSLFD